MYGWSGARLHSVDLSVRFGLADFIERDGPDRNGTDLAPGLNHANDRNAC